MFFRTIFLLAVFLAPATLLHAQDEPADEPTPRSGRIEVGLNITNVLTSFLGTSSGTVGVDPYLFSLRVGQPRRHWRFGADFRVRRRTEGDDIFDRLVLREYSFAARAGYEWVRPLSSRFFLYFGIDLVTDGSYERVESFTFTIPAVVAEHRTGIGAGPVLGARFQLHPRIALTTESSLYGMYRFGSKLVTAQPDQRDTPISEFSLEPVLPTSLFINFLF